MHNDNIDFTEKVDKWRKDPQNKRISVAGDDRSPAWSWIGYCYTNGLKGSEGRLIIPSDNIMTCLRDAGAKMPTGKKNATFKTVTQYGFQLTDVGFKFYNNGEEIKTDWINELRGNNEFKQHVDAVESHGFDLNIKRARIGNGKNAKKHIRVRPQFTNWSAEGDIQVINPEVTGLTHDVCQRLFDIAGSIIGLGDWRPSCASAGMFGCFAATVQSV